ncbi:MAG: DUF2203 domain-containing protein [Terriglobales bacterium]
MSMERTFTLCEAQDLLPLLDSLLQTAMRAHRQVTALDHELHDLISHILISGGVQVDPIHASRLRAERERSGQQLEDAVREIASSGAQLKDLEHGLLDFPCLYHGQIVLLCWKHGEDAIAHWHTTQEGFANRKPLDPSMYGTDSPPHVH